MILAEVKIDKKGGSSLAIKKYKGVAKTSLARYTMFGCRHPDPNVIHPDPKPSPGGSWPSTLQAGRTAMWMSQSRQRQQRRAGYIG